MIVHHRNQTRKVFTIFPSTVGTLLVTVTILFKFVMMALDT